MQEPFYIALWHDAWFRLTNDFKAPRAIDDLEPWIWLCTVIGGAITVFVWAKRRVPVAYYSSIVAWRLPGETGSSLQQAKEFETGTRILGGPTGLIRVHVLATLGSLAVKIGLALGTMIIGVVPGVHFILTVAFEIMGILMIRSAMKSFWSDVRALKYATEATADDVEGFQRTFAQMEEIKAKRESQRDKVPWILKRAFNRNLRAFERLTAAQQSYLSAVRKHVAARSNGQ